MKVLKPFQSGLRYIFVKGNIATFVYAQYLGNA